MQLNPCRVCELLDGDAAPKPDALYCSFCDAWLCGRCRGHYGRRLLAATIDKLTPKKDPACPP